MLKVLKYIFFLAVLLVVIFLLGPRVKYDEADNVPLSLAIPINELDTYVSTKEKKKGDVKPKSAAHFIWQDSLNKTPYAFVYIHGFEASWGEVSPIIQNLSKRYGCNTYLARISQQGLKNQDALVHESPKAMIESAKEAIAIAKLIGDTVIVMSTSTGSTYSIYLAANDPDIHTQIMLAPNIDLYDSRSTLVTGPWGKQILKKLVGGIYHEWVAPEAAAPYWNQKYRIEGLIAVRGLIDQTMRPEIWKKINTPIFVGYYYQDAEHADDVISVPAIHEFKDHIKTPIDRQTFIAFENGTGHVIGSEFMNPNWMVVQDSIFSFIDSQLHMNTTELRELLSNQ